jgi:2-iminoacetate synthase ThiH
MASIVNRALEQAGLGDVLERVLGGEAADETQLARLRSADVLLVAALADAVRAAFHGDEVRVSSRLSAQRDAGLRLVGAAGVDPDKTGQELLIEVALERLATPGKIGLAVGVESHGLQLAQVALSFGANALFGELGSARSLALLDGAAARRAQLSELIAHAGRIARFEEPRPSAVLESRS